MQVGGLSRDGNGVVRQRSLWWPMKLGGFIDSFFRILGGKEPLGIPSTGLCVERSMNTHTPQDQKICLLFVDAENEKRLIWGVDINADQARNCAHQLIMLAEQIEPFFSLEETQKKFRDAILEKETT